MADLKVAFIPLARKTFDIPYAGEMAKRAAGALKQGGLDLILESSLVTDQKEVQRVLEQLDGKELDLAVIFQATFADSTMAAALAEKLDAPLFLWAVPEPHTGERLRLNSLCGINLAGHAFSRSGVSYGYGYADPEDAGVFKKISIHGRVGRALRVLKTAKLGRIGENPAGFETCLYRPEEIREHFGLEIIQLQLEDDIFDSARAVPRDQVDEIKTSLREILPNLDELDVEAVHGTLSVYSVLKNLARQQGLSGFAVRCWPEFFTELGCAACGAMSMLSDELIPCSCEADVNGTITQLLLQSLSGSQAFGSDLVSLDAQQDALVLWHCGLAPLAMADPESEIRATIHSNRQLPLLMDFPLKPGPITLARLSEAGGEYSLVVGEGEMLRSPQSFSGTTGLVRFPRPAEEVLQNILDEGLEHHISLTYGNYQDDLILLAELLNMPVIHIS